MNGACRIRPQAGFSRRLLVARTFTSGAMWRLPARPDVHVRGEAVRPIRPGSGPLTNLRNAVPSRLWE